MDNALQIKIISVAFLIVSVIAPILIVKAVTAATDDLLSVCLFCFICALIVSAFIEFFWTKIDGDIRFLMSMITFGLQCVLIYVLIGPLNIELWPAVVTQAGMFLVLGPILFLFFDLDF